MQGAASAAEVCDQLATAAQPVLTSRAGSLSARRRGFPACGSDRCVLGRMPRDNFGGTRGVRVNSGNHRPSVLSRVCMQASIDLGAQQQLGARAPSFYERFALLVSRPRASLGIAALAFVLTLPAIAMGLTADDFDLALAVRQDPLSAYAYHSRDPVLRVAQLTAARESGAVPWWTDLAVHHAFLRPLSSLSLALDFTLWPSAPWLMHVENALLFGLVVLLAAAIYRELGLSARACGIATAFYAVQGGQSMTNGWIAGRSTLLATLFGLLAVRWFLAARGGKPWAALLAFVAALASGEAGVAALAYIAAAAGLQLKRLWSFGLVVAVWLVLYKLGGYGAEYSGFYADAAHDPWVFAVTLLCAVPIYLASALTLPFASLSGAWPLAMPILTLLSLGILYLSHKLWLPWLQRDPRARVLGLGAVLSILPLGSSPPQDRLVAFIALGVCGLLALIMEERLGPNSVLPQRGARHLFRYHALWAPILCVPISFGAHGMFVGGGGALLDKVVGADMRPVLLLNVSSTLPVHFFSTKRRWFGEARPTLDVLYSGASDLVIERPGEQTLVLTAARGYMASRYERLERDPSRHPLQAGEVVEVQRMRAEVLEVKGGAPTRVRFDFVRPLDELRAFAWQGHALEAVALPAVGGRLELSGAAVL
jgi:hypothetical protein